MNITIRSPYGRSNSTEPLKGSITATNMGRVMRELWPDENSMFYVLYDKFMFWSIVVGIFAFSWMIIAVLRYRAGVVEHTNPDKIEVGTFPVDRHNAKLEFAWFLGPSILIMWVTYIAFGSMNLVWGAYPAEDDAFNVTVTGYQWFWNFEYEDPLTYEDVSSDIDVTFTNDLTITSSNMSAITATISVDGAATDYNLTESTNAMSLYVAMTFDENLFSIVEVKNSEGEVMHTWSHIPVGHQFNTPSNQLIIPCDEDVAFNLHSRAGSDANPAYVGVQHSFWLHEWGMKEDLVPGLSQGTNMFIQPDESGTFPIRCAEYCGMQHSMMTGEVTVVAREGSNCEADYGIVFENREALA